MKIKEKEDYAMVVQEPRVASKGKIETRSEQQNYNFVAIYKNTGRLL